MRTIHLTFPALRPYGFAAALAIALIAVAAHAQESPPIPTDPNVEDGVVNAAALRPIPKDASYTVRAWDNSAEHVQLGQLIEEQLRSRGRNVTTNGDVVLSFAMSDQPGRWSTGAQRQVFELQGRASTAEDDDARVKLNLFSSEKGGVFNQVPAARTVRSTYTLEMTVDRRDGQRLWQGEASAKLGRSDGQELIKLMVPPLLDALGTTVRSRAFGVK